MPAQEVIEYALHSFPGPTPRAVAFTATTALLWAPKDAALIPTLLQEAVEPDFSATGRYPTLEEMVSNAILAGSMAVANCVILNEVGRKTNSSVQLGPKGCYYVAPIEDDQEPLVPVYENLSPEDRFMRAALSRIMKARKNVATQAKNSTSPYAPYGAVWELAAETRDRLPDPSRAHPSRLQRPATDVTSGEFHPERIRKPLSQQLRFVMDYLRKVAEDHPGAAEHLCDLAIKGVAAPEVAAAYPLRVARALMGATDTSSQEYAHQLGITPQLIPTECGLRYAGMERGGVGTMCSAQDAYHMPPWFNSPANPISIIDWHVRLAAKIAPQTLWINR